MHILVCIFTFLFNLILYRFVTLPLLSFVGEMWLIIFFKEKANEKLDFYSFRPNDLSDIVGSQKEVGSVVAQSNLLGYVILFSKERSAKKRYFGAFTHSASSKSLPSSLSLAAINSSKVSTLVKYSSVFSGFDWTTTFNYYDISTFKTLGNISITKLKISTFYGSNK